MSDQRAMIQAERSGFPAGLEGYVACQGFDARGWKCDLFTTEDAITGRVVFTRGVPVVGGLAAMHRAFRAIGVPIPEPIDYPASIAKFRGRKIWRSTLGEVLLLNSKRSAKPVFVKPAKQAKLFTGFVLDTPDSALAILHIDEETEVFVSEVVHFLTEYRVYILRGEIVGCQNYAGDPFLSIDRVTTEVAIRDFQNSGDAPVAYALDMGMRNDCCTRLVEANDAYSLGCYNLAEDKYVNMLLARWGELVNDRPLKEAACP
jgi:hypothetical protein